MELNKSMKESNQSILTSKKTPKKRTLTSTAKKNRNASANQTKVKKNKKTSKGGTVRNKVKPRGNPFYLKSDLFGWIAKTLGDIQPF